MTASAVPPSRPGGPPLTEPPAGDLSAVLRDVPAALGVPFVNLIFHRLAQWPTYLTQVWCRSRPLLGTEEFGRAAQVLHDLADPVIPLEITIPPGVSAAELKRAMTLSDMYAHVQPQLLLLTTAWAAGLDGETPLPSPAPRTGSPKTPKRLFGKDADVPMVDLPPADPMVAVTFEQMIDRRGHPGVASYYRSLAHWPTLLSACWGALEPVTASPDYLLRAHELSSTATALSGSLGLHGAGAVQTADAPELLRLLRSWRDVQVPQLMLDTRHLATALRSAAARRTA